LTQEDRIFNLDDDPCPSIRERSFPPPPPINLPGDRNNRASKAPTDISFRGSEAKSVSSLHVVLPAYPCTALPSPPPEPPKDKSGPDAFLLQFDLPPHSDRPSSFLTLNDPVKRALLLFESPPLPSRTLARRSTFQRD